MRLRVTRLAFLFLGCVSLALAQTSLDDILLDVFGTPDGQNQDTSNQGQGQTNQGQGQMNQGQGQAGAVTPSNNVAVNSGSSNLGNGGFNLDPSTPDAEDNTCLTDEGAQGECVPYYLCSADNGVITDGVGIIDIRIRNASCASYLDLCCKTPDVVETPITPPPPVQPKAEGCGYRNPDGVGFRIKGDKNNEARFGEFPWMVAVLEETDLDDQEVKLNVYVCGGSLIGPSTVLTAAHCVADKDVTKLKARAGEWDTQTVDEVFAHQETNVRHVVIHEHYRKGSLYYDFALLFLEKPFEPAPHIAYACLPGDEMRAPDATRCFASGWGKDQFGKAGHYQVILKRVTVPVVERGRCLQALRRTRLGRFFELHSSFMCAGGEAGSDTCKGDGGSPLVCPIEGAGLERYAQYGIVAWGIGCGEDGTPGVYADTTRALAWVDEQMLYQNQPTNTYKF